MLEAPTLNFTFPYSTQPNTTYLQSNMSEMNAHLAERFNRGGRREDIRDDGQTRIVRVQPSPLIREYFESPSSTSTGWKAQPEVPSTKELLDIPDLSYGEFPNDPSVLPSRRQLPNKISGSYSSKDDYLKTHYELLRYDAVEPLRKAVDAVRTRPFALEREHEDIRSIGIYDRVRIIGVTFSGRGLAVKVCFSTMRTAKKIIWERKESPNPDAPKA